MSATNRGSKIAAAHILSGEGWRADEIARAIAASKTSVEAWLSEPTYVAKPNRGPALCASCGSAGPIKKNHLCDRCMCARDQVIADMRAQGVSWGAIGDAVDLHPVSALNAYKRWRRKSQPVVGPLDNERGAA